MILKSEGDDASKATQRQQLLQMVSYAEDEFECRRKVTRRPYIATASIYGDRLP